VKSGDIERLIDALRGTDPVGREAASARLRVIGGAAIDRLAALVGWDVNPAVRAAAVATLDGIDDPRVVPIAIQAIGDTDPSVRLAAIPVLRSWIAREAGTHVLEALTALALDRHQPNNLRLAALDAISELPRHVVAPILEQAPDAGPRDAFGDAAAARAWVSAHQDGALSQLHDAIAVLRECERAEPSAALRQEWAVARGAAHAALARRESRVALYDLRESFDTAQEPLPLDFLTAVTAIGDSTCLEPMARAWAAAPPGEQWWRERLAAAATDIMHRTRLSGRSALVKRIRAKFDGFL
jgi:hypothetical protein